LSWKEKSNLTNQPSEKHSFCKTKTEREARRIKHEAAKKNMDKHCNRNENKRNRRRFTMENTKSNLISITQSFSSKPHRTKNQPSSHLRKKTKNKT
jgi:hypothetical protein